MPISQSFWQRTPSYWVVVLCAAWVALLAMGIRATFGFFMTEMDPTKLWNSENFATAFGFQNLAWGLSAILMGMIADRFGSGRVVFIGAAFYMSGLIGLYFSQEAWQLFLTMGVLIGIGQAGITFSVLLPLVGRTAPIEQRSTAMGIVTAGGSFGQFLIVPLADRLIVWYGWQFSLISLIALLSSVLVVSFFLRRSAVAWAAQVQQMAQAPSLSMRATIQQALTDPSYHGLLWSYFVCGMHTAFITLHLPKYIAGYGLPSSDAVAAIAFIGFFNVFGSYGAGRLGGIHSKVHLLIGIYAIRTVILLLFILLPLSSVHLYIFAGVMGFVWLGTVPLTTGLIAIRYGVRYAATLSGIAFLGHQLGSFLGAWGGGKAFDLYQSYALLWWLCCGLSVVAALFCLLVKEEPIAGKAPSQVQG